VPGDVVTMRAITGLTLDVVAAAQSGDVIAVNRLFVCIRPALVRYCRARITPRVGHGDADDVAHDICVAVLRGLPTFTGEPQAVTRWVYGIAAHKVIDFYRRSSRDQSTPAEEFPAQVDPHAGPEELALRGEQRVMVQSLLAKLPPAQREILTLRLIVGLSSAETAVITGLSAIAVRVTQHRALNVLRRHVARQPIPPWL
jgi:RNA polymerase sigma-70 factor (ECF subfamily)